MSNILSAGGPNGPMAGGGLFSPTAVKTAAYTASPGDYVPVDATGGAVTVTLPAAPPDQVMVTVRMVRQAGGNAVTVAAGGADVFNAAGGAATLTLASLYQGVIVQYSAVIGVWYVLDLAGQLSGAAFTGAFAPAVVALADGATIAVNAALGNDFRVTLGGNRTLANPSNPRDGQRIVFQVTQDGTGSRTLSYGTAYDFGTAGAPTLTTTASKTDLLKFVYNAAAAKWFSEGSNLGM